MIYDCFTFFNELDLLEMRLNILNEVADRFVLVEATRTFQGKPKPLHYQENKERYRSFHHKIIHVVVDSFPTFFYKGRRPTPWDFEEHQRNSILKGLVNCQADDKIIVSDLDEIPRPEKVKEVQNQNDIVAFRQRNFYYFLNCRSLNLNENWWHGPVMASRRQFKMPQDLRAVSKKLNGGKRMSDHNFFKKVRSLTNPIYRNAIHVAEEGGWHFGFLGGSEKIIEKLEAFSHNEYNTPEFKDQKTIVEAIHAGKDILGRGMKFEFVPMDESYPNYILTHLDQYSHLIRKNP